MPAVPTVKHNIFNLEASNAWLAQIGPNINPVPSDAFVGALLTSGPRAGALAVTNASSKSWGGALLTNKLPAPSAGLPYAGLDLAVFVSSDDLPNLGRLEIDLKVVTKGAPSPTTPILNVYDFSAQLNLSEGQWQIDQNGTWIDTGIQPSAVPVDRWFNVRFRYKMDPDKFSVLSITHDTAFYPVPAPLQNQPLLASNWGPVTAVQLQTEVFNPGSVRVLYKDITLTFSDQPF